MKKIMLVLVAVVILSGCAVRKHCYLFPKPSEVKAVSVGSIIVKNWECFGRITVNQCTEQLELVYLGRTHPGNYIRIGSRVGGSTQFVAEATYPEDSKIIRFKNAKIEVIELNDNWIKFRAIFSIDDCDKVILLDVN